MLICYTITIVRHHGAGTIREWIMSFVSSTLKSFEKWRSPLSGASGNFNHQILPGVRIFLFMHNDMIQLIRFLHM
jgi:hypothetical protein